MQGTLWFGGLTTGALYSWPYMSSGGVELASIVSWDAELLHWIDTFAFDEQVGLL